MLWMLAPPHLQAGSFMGTTPHKLSLHCWKGLMLTTHGDPCNFHAEGVNSPAWLLDTSRKTRFRHSFFPVPSVQVTVVLSILPAPQARHVLHSVGVPSFLPFAKSFSQIWVQIRSLICETQSDLNESFSTEPLFLDFGSFPIRSNSNLMPDLNH